LRSPRSPRVPPLLKPTRGNDHPELALGAPLAIYHPPGMHPAARIIDANANRAREALRVMEDAARFVLDDADLCADLKSLRHDLAAAISAAAAGFGGEAALLAWRDTP